ncbi:DUF2156 domain-containing protein [Clostridium sp. DJ247]|uniref:DUF2156 domain-containing protein n=1 Tax=Clostridium sp. DJ247 TaxID=2726188 RepID=UPI00162418F6|nr:DUF2156 domain-containing protein [Clostridium sp. DJ247]MBC2581831.1 DUF2156 domain-containing protein [Clostridium sp. DJ247]
MLNFNPITIDDKQILDKYLRDYPFTTSEYSFTNLLIWRKGCDIQYTIYNDVLIIKKRDFKEKYHFMQPIGYKKENLKDIIEELKIYKKENRMNYLFKDVENSFLNDLRDIYGDEAHVEEDVDNFDYIYCSHKLMTLSGKKLHSKKNHYNHFIKNYNYLVKDFSESGVIEDCILAAERWYDENYDGSTYITYELEGIKEILNYTDELNLKGMAVYVDNEIAAFTIAERVNDNMAIVHIEKGKTNINGIYAFTNKTFVERYLSEVKYVNREQDLGIEGLRKAKKSYYPIKLEEKYCVNL